MNSSSRILFGQPIVPKIAIAELPFEQAHNPYTISKRTPFQVYFLDSTRETIWEHVYSSRQVECSGVLFGSPFQTANGKIRFVVVVGSIRHETNQRSIGHITVGTEQIAAVRKESEAKYPDLIPVGWYHSHPGHGIFLSAQDMVIVRSIYNLPWHIALVVDPVHDSAGIFWGSEAEKVDGWLELPDDYDWLEWVVNITKISMRGIEVLEDNQQNLQQLDSKQINKTTDAENTLIPETTQVKDKDGLDEEIAEKTFQKLFTLVERKESLDSYLKNRVLRLLDILKFKHPKYKPDEVGQLEEDFTSNSQQTRDFERMNQSPKRELLPPPANRHDGNDFE
jgi:26S proteasome regulatory subunit N11